MIVINMPGGAVQDIDEGDLLWLRKAFDPEWKGATMLQLAEDRIYSIESVADLAEKFENANAACADFSSSGRQRTEARRQRKARATGRRKQSGHLS
jgi:hypothetical protein